MEVQVDTHNSIPSQNSGVKFSYRRNVWMEIRPKRAMNAASPEADLL